MIATPTLAMSINEKRRTVSLTAVMVIRICCSGDIQRRDQPCLLNAAGAGVVKDERFQQCAGQRAGQR